MVESTAGEEDDAQELAWPPTRRDLERLYLKERLPAAKVARLYGLLERYPSPKTAEATILYHLKRNQIARRGSADHVRRVTETTVDEWVRGYRAGESLRQIADAAGPAELRVNAVTVYHHLKRRGILLRNKVEAQISAVTKHTKGPFDGDELERAYLIGLAKGDLNVVRHGRAIRVRLGTTHPAMGDLFRSEFQRYGPVYQYPKLSPLRGFEWCLDCDLDDSFDFLMNLDEGVNKSLSSARLFPSLLSGFFDAEGSIYHHRKKGLGGFELSPTSANEGLLRRIAANLMGLGLTRRIRRDNQQRERGVSNGGAFIWRLILWRFSEVTRLTELHFRHAEKRAKAKIVLNLQTRPAMEDRQKVIAEWEQLKAGIKRDCDEYVAVAKEEFLRRHDGGVHGRLRIS